MAPNFSQGRLPLARGIEATLAQSQDAIPTKRRAGVGDAAPAVPRPTSLGRPDRQPAPNPQIASEGIGSKNCGGIALSPGWSRPSGRANAAETHGGGYAAPLSTGSERVVVVVPTYDERDNLPRVLAAIFAAAPDVDVWVVDDASPDGTGQLADELAANDPRISVVHRAGKQGLGRAYLDAFARAIADPRGYTHVVQMDADLSHDPAAIARLREACRAGADVAVGSRWVPGGRTVDWPLSRRLLSQGGSRYAAAVLGVGVRDLTAGFKCWRSAALAGVLAEDILSVGYGFQIEMTARALRRGLVVREVPITFVERDAGRSKMSGRIVREALVGVWRIRRALAPTARR